jgi:hypothetical protein
MLLWVPHAQLSSVLLVLAMPLHSHIAHMCTAASTAATCRSQISSTTTLVMSTSPAAPPSPQALVTTVLRRQPSGVSACTHTSSGCSTSTAWCVGGGGGGLMHTVGTGTHSCSDDPVASSILHASTHYTAEPHMLGLCSSNPYACTP